MSKGLTHCRSVLGKIENQSNGIPGQTKVRPEYAKKQRMFLRIEGADRESCYHNSAGNILTFYEIVENVSKLSSQLVSELISYKII